MPELIIALGLVATSICLPILLYLIMFKSSRYPGCSGDCDQGRRPSPLAAAGFEAADPDRRRASLKPGPHGAGRPAGNTR